MITCTGIVGRSTFVWPAGQREPFCVDRDLSAYRDLLLAQTGPVALASLTTPQRTTGARPEARPEPVPLSFESRTERPKLPPPGSPPVLPVVVVQSSSFRRLSVRTGPPTKLWPCRRCLSCICLGRGLRLGDEGTRQPETAQRQLP
jgi:hypothetical protein